MTDALVTIISLEPEQMRLSFVRGDQVEIADTALLWDLGLRHDDAVTLEFESPVVPDQLKLLRSPSPEKPEKGKGKKKK